jgi:hypothetical protein
VAIASLSPGRKVLAGDPRTGKVGPEPVTAVLINHDKNLFDLTIRASGRTVVIKTTSNHPIWDVTSHQWTKAGALRLGDRLLTPAGQTAKVIGGRVPLWSSGPMWDLTVAARHTFFVAAGSTSVLVHNCTPKKTFKWSHSRKDGNEDFVADQTDQPTSFPQGTSPMKPGDPLSEGDYTYVVKTDGSLQTMNDVPLDAADGGHMTLSGGDDEVNMAGTYHVNGQGQIESFDNFSGHYMPGNDPSGVFNETDYMPLEDVARDAFRSFGLPDPLPGSFHPFWGAGVP